MAQLHSCADLKEACRLPVRVQKQQAQELAVNAAYSAGDDRQAVQLTAMIPPCPGCLQLGEAVLRSGASSSAQRPRGSAGS